MLHVFYNKINIKYTFEILPFFSHENVAICSGLDVLSRLNIGITGLVSSHFDHTGLENLILLILTAAKQMIVRWYHWWTQAYAGDDQQATQD